MHDDIFGMTDGQKQIAVNVTGDRSMLVVKELE
jgi:hypothetical protein